MYDLQLFSSPSLALIEWLLSRQHLYCLTFNTQNPSIRWERERERESLLMTLQNFVQNNLFGLWRTSFCYKFCLNFLRIIHASGSLLLLVVIRSSLIEHKYSGWAWGKTPVHIILFVKSLLKFKWIIIL